MVGDTILIKDISINGNDGLKKASDLSKELTDNTINALGIDASSRTIWINGQPYGNAYVNIKEDGTIEKPIGGEIFNDFEHNIASGDYSHASGFCTKTTNKAEAAFGKFNQSTKDSTLFSIGDGVSDGERHNIVEVTEDEVNINTNLIVSSVTTIGGGVDVNGSLEVFGDATIEGGLTVKKDIEVEGLGDGDSGNDNKLLKNSIIVAGSAEGSGVMKGANNSAGGKNSLALGVWCKTTNEGEHASGKYNQSNNNTIHSVGIGASVDDRKNAEEIHDNSGDKYVIGIGGYDGTNSAEVDVKTVQTVINESINQITINYLKLKELRDASQLVPGQEYRITDYTCTTTQTGTRSAGNVFDIIVTADNESVLNEEARAIHHTNDENDYFHNNDLSAWKIWYCLDNDTNRFVWADDTNGKGVIYRMIDEFNNDVPYDFKNIQFYRKWDSSMSLWCTISSVNDSESKPCYTFSSRKNESDINDDVDTSLLSSNYVHSNIIKAYIKSNAQTLNNICLFGSSCYDNTFGNNCYSNTFGSGCYNNSFGNNCHESYFRNNCYTNILGNNCYSIGLLTNCFLNIFENYCYRIYLGNYCSKNSFGSDCSYISFSSTNLTTTRQDYYQHNHFEAGCRNIYFLSVNTNQTSPIYVQNYTFSRGVFGSTQNDRLNITAERGRVYDTYISFDSDGMKQESVIADKLDKMIELNYLDLLRLRESDGLVPGQQYRIIDYDTIVNEQDTVYTSAHHQFDIIVTADDESTLNEVARAVKRPGDKYFNSCNLNTWKIWYCLDNDASRFAWADSSKDNKNNPNGRGVIYRMIDDFGNDCPYDFKNIQFYRKQDPNTKLWSIIPSVTDTIEGFVPCYTFSSNTINANREFEDLSITKNTYIYSNVIKKYINSKIQDLNNICFFGYSCFNNTFDNDCYKNTLGSTCHKNTFGRDSYRNIFGNGCTSNVIKNSCSNNTLGSYCSCNTFGNSCDNNILGSYCTYNTFGNGCENIKFMKSIEESTIYNYYRQNYFGDRCRYILFKGIGNASSYLQVQNYKFAQGTDGTLGSSTGVSYIGFQAVAGLNYETYVGRDSKGSVNLISKCLLD